MTFADSTKAISILTVQLQIENVAAISCFTSI